MVIKAARIGILITVSLSCPISSGIVIAKRTGVALLCFTRGKRMNIYTFPEGVILD